MFSTWITIAIVGLIAATLAHSYGGERYLLRPMFRQRGNRVLDNALARVVLRLAWHVTGLMWLVLASILFALAHTPAALAPTILWSIGLAFTASGLIDLVASRGRHVGWPILTLVGLAVLGALAQMP